MEGCRKQKTDGTRSHRLLRIRSEEVVDMSHARLHTFAQSDLDWSILASLHRWNVIPNSADSVGTSPTLERWPWFWSRQRPSWQKKPILILTDVSCSFPPITCCQMLICSAPLFPDGTKWYVSRWSRRNVADNDTGSVTFP